jgi:hypothetical protein
MAEDEIKENRAVPQAQKRTQKEVRKYIPGDVADLTEELLAARRRDGSLR